MSEVSANNVTSGTTNVDSSAESIAKTAGSSLPIRKRKQEHIATGDADAGVSDPSIESNEVKRVKTVEAQPEFLAATTAMSAPATEMKPLKRAPMSKAREIRLEQNRKAARESRRRKKIMVDELQRSVVFFSRANSTLKQQNEELQRILLHAQSKIQATEKARIQQQQTGNNSNSNNNGESAQQNAAPTANAPVTNIPQPIDISQAQAQQALANAQSQTVQNLTNSNEQSQAHQAAQAAATQAMFESQGFPPAAARAAAATFVAGAVVPPTTTTTATGSNESTQAHGNTVTTQGQAATNMGMAANPWPFFIALAPGQMFAQAAGAQASNNTPNKNQQQQQPQINPFMTMQMIPFFNQGMNASVVPSCTNVNGTQNSNNVGNASVYNTVNQTHPTSTIEANQTCDNKTAAT